MATEHDIIAETVAAHSAAATLLMLPLLAVGAIVWTKWAIKHENDPF